jgi:hypothetical protein
MNSSEVELQPKKNWFVRHEFLYSIIAILLVLLIVSSTYLWKVQKQISKDLSVQAPMHKQSEVPSNWKTYTDSRNVYQIKYPDKYVLASANRLKTQDNSVLIDFNYGPDKYNDINNSKSHSTLFINGIKAYKITGLGGIGTDSYSIWITAADGNYAVISFSYPEGREENFSEFNQILSTFKFTDSTTDTSTWKTYRNDQYNFSLKYPESYEIEVQAMNINVTPKEVNIEDGRGVYIYFAPGSLNIETERIVNQANSLAPGNAEVKDITFAGIAAKQIIYEAELGGTVKDILFPKNNKVIDITLLFHLADTDDQILSTFKFTN